MTEYRPESRGDNPAFESVDTSDISVGESKLATSNNTLPVITAVGVEKQSVSTTNTSYQTDRTFAAVRVPWGEVFNDTQTISVGIAVRVESGTADLRFQNATVGETIVEETGVESGQTSGNVFLGFADYEPPDRNSTDLCWLEYQSDDGDEAVIQDPLIYVGIRF